VRWADPVLAALAEFLLRLCGLWPGAL